MPRIFEDELIEEQTGYSLDLSLRSYRVAVEVDGPSHFVRCREGKCVPNGPTLLKQRQLKAAGWRVVSVPFYEWAGLEPGEQRAYLARQLAAVGLVNVVG